jgi:RNA polymerase sigma factor (sigma-70 family)
MRLESTESSPTSIPVDSNLVTEVSWPDRRLVRECLSGNESAWAALIDKYKNLIYSIPIRWGFSQDDATDIFQSVAGQLLAELNRLREPDALAAWLIRVTANQCIQVRKQQSRAEALLQNEPAFPAAIQPSETPESLLEMARREQILRHAVLCASPRCRQLIEMLFFENPARPYPEVAASLGLAVGSVGFIRRRCLDQLRMSLEEAGF